MGYPMASNLRKNMNSSATLTIFDVNGDSCRKLKEEVQHLGQIVVANSVKEVVESSVRPPLLQGRTYLAKDIVLSIVTAADNVRAVYLDSASGVLAVTPKEKAPKLFMECSTIDADTTRHIGKAVEQAGLGRVIGNRCSDYHVHSISSI